MVRMLKRRAGVPSSGSFLEGIGVEADGCALSQWPVKDVAQGEERGERGVRREREEEWR